MITFKHGNIFDTDLDWIAHGCNIQGDYAAGMAGQVATRNPLAKSAYELAVLRKDFYLGAVQFIPNAPNAGYGIINMATQRYPGRSGSEGLHAIELAFANLVEACQVRGIWKIAMPRIGCGIAGQRWPDVENAIHNGVLSRVIAGPELVVYDLERHSDTIYS